MARLTRRRYSWKRSLAIILVGLALALSVGWALVQPLRPILAARYLQRGDARLSSQEFSAAEDEYRLALRYQPSNAEAANHLQLAQKGLADPAVLRDFYQQHGVESELSKLDRATRSFASPKDALVAGVSLYASQDYGYARYAMEKATEMDPQYAEAWNYLVLNDRQLAKLDSSYVALAQAAQDKRDSLTTQYLGQ